MKIQWREIGESVRGQVQVLQREVASWQGSPVGTRHGTLRGTNQPLNH